ncbi:MAG: MarR family transcriptional regulator [Pseudomonadota bacterium]
MIRRVIQLRQRRACHIGVSHLSEAAWDILLDIYACELEGVAISVTAIGIDAGIAPATAQRWITRLVAQGVLLRIVDPKDRRRAHISLAPGAASGMRNWHAEAHILLASN